MQSTTLRIVVVTLLGLTVSGCKSVPRLAWWKSKEDAADAVLAASPPDIELPSQAASAELAATKPPSVETSETTAPPFQPQPTTQAAAAKPAPKAGTTASTTYPSTNLPPYSSAVATPSPPAVTRSSGSGAAPAPAATPSPPTRKSPYNPNGFYAQAPSTPAVAEPKNDPAPRYRASPTVADRYRTATTTPQASPASGPQSTPERYADKAAKTPSPSANVPSRYAAIMPTAPKSDAPSAFGAVAETGREKLTEKLSQATEKMTQATASLDTAKAAVTPASSNALRSTIAAVGEPTVETAVAIQPGVPYRPGGTGTYVATQTPGGENATAPVSVASRPPRPASTKPTDLPEKAAGSTAPAANAPTTTVTPPTNAAPSRYR